TSALTRHPCAGHHSAPPGGVRGGHGTLGMPRPSRLTESRVPAAWPPARAPPAPAPPRPAALAVPAPADARLPPPADARLLPGRLAVPLGQCGCVPPRLPLPVFRHR